MYSKYVHIYDSTRLDSIDLPARGGRGRGERPKRTPKDARTGWERPPPHPHDLRCVVQYITMVPTRYRCRRTVDTWYRYLASIIFFSEQLRESLATQLQQLLVVDRLVVINHEWQQQWGSRCRR
jgi:hypothetical protein